VHGIEERVPALGVRIDGGLPLAGAAVLLRGAAAAVLLLDAVLPRPKVDHQVHLAEPRSLIGGGGGQQLIVLSGRSESSHLADALALGVR
jgi:hypothetical protein